MINPASIHVPVAFARRFSRHGLRDLLALARQRRQLGRLDARLLDDIGVDSVSARAEAARPIWDVPARWRA